MSRFTGGTGAITAPVIEERLKRVEQQLDSINAQLTSSFVLGRLRTDRIAPIDSNDVKTLDLLYDIVRDTGYEYVLIDNGGTAQWVRITMSTF